MAKRNKLPPDVREIAEADTSFEHAIVKSRSFNPDFKPDIDSVKEIKLHSPDTSRQYAYKIARYWTIRDRHTSSIHHSSLSIETIYKRKNGWLWQGHRSVTIDTEDGTDEIAKLFNFLAAESQINGDSEVLVVSLEKISADRFVSILESISSSSQKSNVLEAIVNWINVDRDAIFRLSELARKSPHRSQSLVAAINYGRYKQALDTFAEIIEQDSLESVYQKFLEENYWIFGSEYSELIPNRNIVNRMQLDFPLRRTVDGFLDIVEIKRPRNHHPLFRKDSRSNLTPTTDLSEAVTQAEEYLSAIDADQYRIVFHEHLDVEKVRARVIIGRDHDTEQMKRLRKYNAMLHRIEVLTFDQLLRVGKRVLDILVRTNALPVQSIDDIPF